MPGDRFCTEQVIFPWYYFGSGAKFRINDRLYRVSFVKPNGAEDIPGRLLAMTGVGLGAGLATVVQKMVDIKDGRRAGKAWKGMLAALNSQREDCSSVQKSIEDCR